MKSPIAPYCSGFTPVAAQIDAGIASLPLLSSGASAEEPGTHVAGWSLVDPSQRHPILVSQQPATLSIRVARGAHGLTRRPDGASLRFSCRAIAATDAGNSKLVIAVPSGSPNESAAMRAVGDMRELISDFGFSESHGRDRALQRRPRLQRTRSASPICATWRKHLNAGTGPPIWPTIRATCPIRTSVAHSSTILLPRSPIQPTCSDRARWRRLMPSGVRL